MLTFSIPDPLAAQQNPNSQWKKIADTVAGGNGQGNSLCQLSFPSSLYIDDDDGNFCIADHYNHRIIEWKLNETEGHVIAGGNGHGMRTDQLSQPLQVIVDKVNDTLIISDYSNRRVVQWARRNGISGEIIVSNIDCWGLAMDKYEYLYVVDNRKHEVRRYASGQRQGTVVAGGHGRGDRLDQLHSPTFVFVDEHRSLYVSDEGNNRVVKWEDGANQGIVVAGGQGEGSSLAQLSCPTGVVVDEFGNIYVSDNGNHRIMRWLKGATEGTVIVGGNGRGTLPNQLNVPAHLTFDRNNNLYVVDWGNHRIQKFEIESSENEKPDEEHV